MPQISLRISDEVDVELERGRIAQHFSTRSDYISALILSGAGRMSGLAEPETFVLDTRVGNAIANAISLISDGDSAGAVTKLRFVQDIITQAFAAKAGAINRATDERLRIRGGGDDWTEKPSR